MSDPNTRIGNGERANVIELLHAAAGDGRLNQSELGERIQMVNSARIQADLDQVLFDLGPVELGSSRPAQPYAQGIPVPGFAPDDPLVLSAGASSEKRTGPWEVPGWIQLRTDLGSIHLNCLEATTRFAVIDMTVSVGLGSAVLILPDGWAANVDRLGRGIGSVRNKVAPTPEPGCPTLLLHGTTGAGSLTIRYANRFDRWRLRRRQAKRAQLAITTGEQR